MQKKRLHLCMLVLAFAFLLLGSLTAQAAEYEWKYDKENLKLSWINTETGEPVRSRFVRIKGYTYYFDANGYAATGWTKIKKYTYYFDASGAMQTDTWINDYYLDSTGKLVTNRWVLDASGLKVYVGKDGKFIANYNKKAKVGLKKTAKGTRFRQADGTYAQKQWVCWKGYWYYFYTNGYMAKKAFIGKHYVDKNGRMLTNCTKKIGRYRYTFDKSGEIVKKIKVKSSK